MTKREAKRLACYMAAEWIQGMVDIGDARAGEDEVGNELPREDALKLQAALEDIANEMLRRWGRGESYARMSPSGGMEHGK